MNISPYNDAALNVMYNQLFCDIPELYNNQTAGYPWDVLFNNKSSHQQLLSLASDTTAESRIKLLAYNQLKTKGYPVDSKELLGVIIEVGLENGLDVVAAFKDGTARYINQSGKLIIWETKTDESKKLVDDLFAASLEVVSKIGAWDKARLPQPGKDQIRINFLVAEGLYFGQGPFEVLARDAMGGPVIHAAQQLLVFLTDKALAKVD